MMHTSPADGRILPSRSHILRNTSREVQLIIDSDSISGWELSNAVGGVDADTIIGKKRPPSYNFGISALSRLLLGPRPSAGMLHLQRSGCARGAIPLPISASSASQDSDQSLGRLPLFIITTSGSMLADCLREHGHSSSDPASS